MHDDGPSIVWHLGLQKTGTTTIQKFINRNAAHFEQYAALFVKKPGDRSSEIGLAAKAFSGKVAANLRHKREERLRMAVADIVASAETHPRKTALVSDENMLGHWIYRNGISIFDRAERLMPELRRLAYPAHSHFIIYIRKLEKWLDSCWAQEVEVRVGTKPRQEWRDELPFTQSWDKICSRLNLALEGSAASVSYVQMEDEIASSLPFGTGVLQAIGVEEEKLKSIGEPVAANISLKPSATEFLREVNSVGLDNDTRKRIRAILRRRPELFA